MSEASSSVVNMAAEVIAKKQREQKQQQQAQGNSNNNNNNITPRCHFCGEAHWIYSCPFMNPITGVLKQEENDIDTTSNSNYSSTADFTDDHGSEIFDSILREEGNDGITTKKDDNGHDDDSNDINSNNNTDQQKEDDDDDEGDLSTQFLLGDNNDNMHCNPASFDCFND